MSDKSRHSYIIKTESGREMRSPIVYRYSGLDIELHLSASGYLIRYSRPKLVTDLRSDPYFRDAVLKAELLYLLKYSRKPARGVITAVIDGTEYCVCDKETELVYSMFSKVLSSGMNKAWNSKSVINTIASTPKSKHDRRFAALFALLMAKSKSYESEKFMYLWMSMNALYGYLAEFKEWKGRPRESDQMSLIASLHGLHYYNIGKPYKDQLRGMAMDAIAQLDREAQSALAAKVENLQKEWDDLHVLKATVNKASKPGRMDMAAFFLFWLPYQIRCKYFHGEKSMPVMCFYEEQPIPSLRFLNKVLMNFLDKELPKWFDQEALDKELLPRVRSITGDEGRN